MTVSKIKNAIIISLIGLIALAFSVSVCVIIDRVPEVKGEVVTAAGSYTFTSSTDVTNQNSMEWYANNTYFYINDYAGLQKFANSVGMERYTGETILWIKQYERMTYFGKTVYLNSDIYCSGKEHFPIGANYMEKGFMGQFYGNKHTISNFKITLGGNFGGYYTGFFAKISRDGTGDVGVRDLKLEGAEIYAYLQADNDPKAYIGGLVGVIDQGCYINNCEVKEFVINSEYCAYTTHGYIYNPHYGAIPVTGQNGGTYYAGIVCEVSGGQDNADKNLVVENCKASEIEMVYVQNQLTIIDGVGYPSIIGNNNSGRYMGIGPAIQNSDNTGYYTVKSCYYDKVSMIYYPAIKEAYCETVNGQVVINSIQFRGNTSSVAYVNSVAVDPNSQSGLGGKHVEYCYSARSSNISSFYGLKVSQYGGPSNVASVKDHPWYFYSGFDTQPYLRDLMDWTNATVKVDATNMYGSISVDDRVASKTQTLYLPNGVVSDGFDANSANTKVQGSTLKAVASSGGHFFKWTKESQYVFVAHFYKKIELTFIEGYDGESLDENNVAIQDIKFSFYDKVGSSVVKNESNLTSLTITAINMSSIAISFKSETDISSGTEIGKAIYEFKYKDIDAKEHNCIVTYALENKRVSTFMVDPIQSGLSTIEYFGGDTGSVSYSSDTLPIFEVAGPKAISFLALETGNNNKLNYNTVSYVKIDNPTTENVESLRTFGKNLVEYKADNSYTFIQSFDNYKISALYAGSTIEYLGNNYFFVRQLDINGDYFLVHLVRLNINYQPNSSSMDWRGFRFTADEILYKTEMESNIFNGLTEVEQPILQNFTISYEIKPVEHDVRIDFEFHLREEDVQNQTLAKKVTKVYKEDDNGHTTNVIDYYLYKREDYFGTYNKYDENVTWVISESGDSISFTNIGNYDQIFSVSGFCLCSYDFHNEDLCSSSCLKSSYQPYCTKNEDCEHSLINWYKITKVERETKNYQESGGAYGCPGLGDPHTAGYPYVYERVTVLIELDPDKQFTQLTFNQAENNYQNEGQEQYVYINKVPTFKVLDASGNTISANATTFVLNVYSTTLITATYGIDANKCLCYIYTVTDKDGVVYNIVYTALNESYKQGDIDGMNLTVAQIEDKQITPAFLLKDYNPEFS